ncbi:transposase domain containing protein [Nephila pilipes]|uniref:Transposase domain containing protein n=1 Tax=Nephila pilipes TaxID=299642 RepID=A0A8X6QUU3_NEPPI|nr:transposase domain containing protein [Nephila pilipes]
MGRQLRVQRPPIRNISNLRDHCLFIWYNLSPVLYQGLVASMPRLFLKSKTIWDVMGLMGCHLGCHGTQLTVQRPPIRNISDLRDRCLNIWYNLSPIIYQGLVASMPRRVEAVL